jgi:hypothetical protein
LQIIYFSKVLKFQYKSSKEILFPFFLSTEVENLQLKCEFIDDIYTITAQEFKELNIAPEQFFHSFPIDVYF